MRNIAMPTSELRRAKKGAKQPSGTAAKQVGIVRCRCCAMSLQSTDHLKEQVGQVVLLRGTECESGWVKQEDREWLRGEGREGNTGAGGRVTQGRGGLGRLAGG